MKLAPHIFLLFRFPFDWKNPLGYFIAVYLQFIIVSMPLQYMGCFLTFALTAFLYSLSLAKNMTNNLRSVDKNAKAKLPQTVIYKEVCEMIRVTHIKRLVAV